MSEPPHTPYPFPIDFDLNFIGTPIEGKKGAEVQLRTSATHIQYKYDREPDTAWRDLFSLAEVGLRIRVFNGKIQWAPTSVDSWSDIATLESLRGYQGFSAYEVWRNAGNTGTVADYLRWLADAQIASILPYTNRAEAAAVASEASKTTAGASAATAVDAATTATSSAQATAADRVATGADRAVAVTKATEAKASADASEVSRLASRQAQLAAETARTGSEAAKTASETARDNTYLARDTAVSAKDMAVSSALSADADAVAAEASRLAAEAAKLTLETARDTAVAAKDATVLKAAEAEASRQAAATAKTAAELAATQTAQDRLATKASEEAAELAQTTTQGLRDASSTFRDEALLFRNEAENYRDQSQAIAGGNFQPGDPTLTGVSGWTWASGKTVFAMTSQDVFTALSVGAANDTDLLDRVAGDGRYRLKTTALTIGDITNLQGNLDAKATPADIQAAVDALVAGAPGALDTLYEIAAKFAADDDAMAALMAVVAEKAGQDVVDLLTARVEALEAIKPILTINGLTPEPDGNIAFSVETPIPSEVVLTRTAGVLSTITETVEGDPRITTLTRTAGVLSQTVTTYRGKTVTNIFNRTAGRLTGVTTTEA